MQFDVHFQQISLFMMSITDLIRKETEKRRSLYLQNLPENLNVFKFLQYQSNPVKLVCTCKGTLQIGTANS